jgi:hypothetical protein
MVRSPIGREGYFRAMLRWVFRSLVVYFMAIALSPALLFVQFQLRRDYIERELCVQREVVEEMRTCHGDCFLAKRYKALEREAEKGFPADRLVRFEPLMAEMERDHLIIVPDRRLQRHDPERPVISGFARWVDHVPRV